MVPPEALGNGPSAKEQQMQLVIGQAQQTIKDLMQQASIDQIKLKAKSELRDIDVYEAETKRISALSQMMPEGDPEAVKGFYVMLKDLVADMMRTDLGPVLKANEDDLAAAALDHRANAPKQPTPNMPGARRAADGQLYVPDPQRPGKYIMVQ